MLSWHRCRSGRSGQRLTQVGSDLLRAPLQIELGLHLRPQVKVGGQLRSARPHSPLTAAMMRQVRVVPAIVMRSAVTTKLPTDRRRGTTEPRSYLPYRQAAIAQRGNSYGYPVASCFPHAAHHRIQRRPLPDQNVADTKTSRTG